MTLLLWFFSLFSIGIGLREYSKSLFKIAPKKNDSSETSVDNSEFKSFQIWYIIIFILSRLSDWMLGPYIVAIYDRFNYSESDKAILFMFGYLTSGAFGIFIGSIADKFGRKLTCIIFCALFPLSSMIMITFGDTFWLLLCARFLSGISTSILHSVFESYLITHHKLNKYPINKLNETFEISNSINSIVAIFAGIIGSTLISIYERYNLFTSLPKCAAPLHFSCVICVITMYLIMNKWTENYGQQSMNDNLLNTMKKSFNVIFNDKRIILIGIIQSGFESSLYIFVFKWTPILDSVYFGDNDNDKFDHGLVFAIMMISCFIGCCIITIIRLKYNGYNHGYIQCIEMNFICIISAISLFMVLFINDFNSRLLLFIIYEICVGGYRPTLSSLRSKLIPHHANIATIINIFRIPLNIIVVIVLTQIEYFQNTVFLITTMLLMICSLSSYHLSKII